MDPFCDEYLLLRRGVSCAIRKLCPSVSYPVVVADAQASAVCRASDVPVSSFFAHCHLGPFRHYCVGHQRRRFRCCRCSRYRFCCRGGGWVCCGYCCGRCRRMMWMMCRYEGNEPEQTQSPERHTVLLTVGVQGRCGPSFTSFRRVCYVYYIMDFGRNQEGPWGAICFLGPAPDVRSEGGGNLGSTHAGYDLALHEARSCSVRSSRNFSNSRAWRLVR